MFTALKLSSVRRWLQNVLNFDDQWVGLADMLFEFCEKLKAKSAVTGAVKQKFISHSSDE